MTVPATTRSSSTTRRLFGAHGEDADLGQVEDRVELPGPVHPQVRDGERAAGKLFAGQGVGSRRGGQRLGLDPDLGSPRASALCKTGTIKPSSRATAMPILTSPWRTMASGSKLAFKPGWSRSARATALVTKSPREILIPSRARCLLISSRAAAMRSTRTSMVRWISGARLLGLEHALGDRLAHPRVRDTLGGRAGGRGRDGLRCVAASRGAAVGARLAAWASP